MSAVLLRADHDRNGNPRRSFIVLNARGIVEVLEEGYNGDAFLRARWPWFDHNACDRHGLEPAYYASVDTSPAEIRRLEKLERYMRDSAGVDANPYVQPLRDAADRQHARSAAEDAVQDVRRHEVHVHGHDTFRRHKLRALRAVPGIHETDHGRLITFRLES